MNDPLEAFGISKEEVQKVDEDLISKRPRDGRICICGHGTYRHKIYAGHNFCEPSRMKCPCKAFRPVLEVEDTRTFLRKTTGAGPLHALMRGLAAMPQDKYQTARWLVDIQCDVCGGTDNLSPVPVTENKIAVDYATGFDALLCGICRTSEVG
jgi:hypothetical protein